MVAVELDLRYMILVLIDDSNDRTASRASTSDLTNCCDLSDHDR